MPRVLSRHFSKPYSSVDHSPAVRERLYLMVKRGYDFLFSALALIALSPLLLVIALLIVLDDPQGGPIFQQTRCGLNGKPFTMYKFRTMCVDAEQQLDQLLEQNEMNGPVFKIKSDPRITRVGKFLRETGIDELPQLFNVLRGDMSLVGPRPALPREVEQYTQYQRQRLTVVPGLTCDWQVQPNRNHISFDDWMKLDLQYIETRSFLRDWALIFKTVGAVLRRQGV